VKRALLLQAVVEGRTLVEAAERADLSYRHARRVAASLEFQQEKQVLLAELAEADSNALAEYRRDVGRAARFALGKQMEVLNSAAPNGEKAAGGRDVQKHLARLYPAALDIAVSTAQLVQSGQPQRTLGDIFDVPVDADGAGGAGLRPGGVRAADLRLACAWEPTEGEQHTAKTRGQEPPANHPQLSPNQEMRWAELRSRGRLTFEEQWELDSLTTSGVLDQDHAMEGR
jgi:hypothetical protein